MSRPSILPYVGTMVDTQPDQHVVHYSDTYHLISAATVSLDGKAVYEVQDRILLGGMAIIATRKRITCEENTTKHTKRELPGELTVDTSGLTTAQVSTFAERLKVASSPFLRDVAEVLSGGKRKGASAAKGAPVESKKTAVAVTATATRKKAAVVEEAEEAEDTPTLDTEDLAIADGDGEARSFKKDLPSELRIRTAKGKGEIVIELTFRGGAWTLFEDDEVGVLGVANQTRDELDAEKFEFVKTVKSVKKIGVTQAKKDIVEVDCPTSRTVHIFLQYKEKKREDDEANKVMAFFFRYV